MNKDIKKAERPGLDTRSPARFYYAPTVLSPQAEAALDAALAGKIATALTVVGAELGTRRATSASVLARATSATAPFAGGARAAIRAASIAGAGSAAGEYIADTAAALSVDGAGCLLR